jgi:hypothetical protein
MGYDAASFLAGLYADDGPAEAVDRASLRRELAGLIRAARRAGDRFRAVAIRETFNERAAIREYDGRQSRHVAEAGAASETLAAWDLAEPEPEPAQTLFGNGNVGGLAWAQL